MFITGADERGRSISTVLNIPSHTGGIMSRLTIGALVLALSGCAYGIKAGKTYPAEEFTADMGYQATFRLMDAQPRDCIANANVTSNLYTDNKTGVIRTNIPPYSEGDSLRIDIAEGPNGTTKIKATVMDVGIYDAAMLDALKRTAESGKVVCRDSAYWKTHRVGG